MYVYTAHVQITPCKQAQEELHLPVFLFVSVFSPPPVHQPRGAGGRLPRRPVMSDVSSTEEQVTRTNSRDARPDMRQAGWLENAGMQIGLYNKSSYSYNGRCTVQVHMYMCIYVSSFVQWQNGMERRTIPQNSMEPS